MNFTDLIIYSIPGGSTTVYLARNITMTPDAWVEADVTICASQTHALKCQDERGESIVLTGYRFLPERVKVVSL